MITGLFFFLTTLSLADSGNPVRSASLAKTIAMCGPVAPGSSVYVQRTLKQACRPWLVHRGKVAYQLTRLPNNHGDIAQVRLKIRFRIPKKVASARRAEMVRNAEACLPMIERIWHRYGVDFDLRLDSADVPTAGAPDHQILMTDDSGRFHQDHYNYRGQVFESCLRGCSTQGAARANCLAYCESQRQREFCAKMTHEVGHLLGLLDEYPDPQCTSPRLLDFGIRPISIMAITGLVDADQMDFHPRHLETVLAPVCR